MQLQYEKKEIPCLQTIKRELQTQEQTQELRISDGMPDIGSIVGTWGQVILRGKEWQETGMTVNGGTMVWVQYIPEGGGTPQCVESWIPFQMRWTLPQTQYDGKILTQCALRSVDARSTSARRMMVRTNVSVLALAMENDSCQIFDPAEVPKDVYLKKQNYLVQLPTEAGEKAFALEEHLQLPANAPKLEDLISYRLCPEITEEKLMNDKVVFRGNAALHILYTADDGGEYAWTFDLPFTQYTELEKEYGEDGEVMLLPCVTALELDREDDGMTVKIGLVCQYWISNRATVEITEDAYSVKRTAEPTVQQLQLPGILESKTQSIHIQCNMPVDAMRLTDVSFEPLTVHVDTADNGSIAVAGIFRLYHCDMEGKPKIALHKWEQRIPMPIGEGAAVDALVLPIGKPQATLLPGNAQLSGDLKLITQTRTVTGIPMVTSMELGEIQPMDSARPSMILRRSGGKTLWELAKNCGSSVDMIREANRLQAEPEESQMLLIPVLS